MEIIKILNKLIIELNNMTKEKQCNCVSEYQDAQYGKNNRVHNENNKGLKCTVCGNQKLVGGGPAKSVAKK